MVCVRHAVERRASQAGLGCFKISTAMKLLDRHLPVESILSKQVFFLVLLLLLRSGMGGLALHLLAATPPPSLCLPSHTIQARNEGEPSHKIL